MKCFFVIKGEEHKWDDRAFQESDTSMFVLAASRLGFLKEKSVLLTVIKFV